MKTTTDLSKHHQQTYDAIFQHPIARHLHRRDVTAMLGALAEVTEEQNGNLKATRNGHTLVLHATHDKNVAARDELMLIRHFLEHSAKPVGEVPQDAGRVLVVMDHREARVFQTESQGSVPRCITPLAPHGFGRNLHHVEDDGNGQRRPENKSFYEAIAEALRTAKAILIFGSGTGASSAMEQLLAVLREHHPETARRVVGSIALDTQHLTEGQLLAKAREVYEARAISNSAI